MYMYMYIYIYMYMYIYVINESLINFFSLSRKAGAVYKLKREGRITPSSFQHRILRAATPPMSFHQYDGYVACIQYMHIVSVQL